MSRFYFDHAAATPVREEVVAEMEPYFSKKFGNPSSLHNFGQEAKEALEKSRVLIGELLNANPKDIVFTSGGTESNNLALKGVAFANKEKGKHIIVSKIEHPCVMNSAKWLESQGFEVTYLDVDKYGVVNPSDVEKAIKKGTILVSVMHANNEIGTVEPIEEIGKICNDKDVIFHTDAVQTFGRIPIDVKNVDLLTACSHKVYGPKGVGLLYVKEGTKIEPLIHGGGHEKGLRSGTENVAGIAGFSKAAYLAYSEMNEEGERLTKMRDRIIKEVLEIEDSFLNGHPTKRLQNNAHFCFRYIEGEALALHLDDKGIEASTGSACSSKKLEPSYVLLALGLKREEAHGSLRLTLGRKNNDEQVDYLLKELPPIVKKLREMSPFTKGSSWE